MLQLDYIHVAGCMKNSVSEVGGIFFTPMPVIGWPVRFVCLVLAGIHQRIGKSSTLLARFTEKGRVCTHAKLR
jgi:hypothetical protein